ncbi:murein DD-endopeptidase MepM/ murein hydrolase activator NlpD [Microbacterium sp. AK009]|uniref:murein hydrolase activator EnvC family protein n=1 Tax=Microbacterium sp. AK009 TaxID=2723068 RepID=UPI0015C8F268|nr:M23 family metallopeptidase [Microbacterium sp. AK009]NYF17154.1 murein DD-endopeptidase MepM/ murein hydrolase activator NlpD [Microbacterium sp. AK009]
MAPRTPAGGRHPTNRREGLRLAVVLGVVLAVVAGLGPAGAAAPDGGAAIPHTEEWGWPLEPFRLVRPYIAPAHEYAPGHRGIDIAPVGSRSSPDIVAPAEGVIVFSGQVAGRPVITIDHGAGLVSTLEPAAGVLPPGTAVGRGDVVAALSAGGHSAPGTLHFGVRRDGAYINPMLLLGGVPRAVLLPCC